MNKTFKDQLGRMVSFGYPPQKIISLVPSQSELLHYLGLKKELIGITKFCVHPKDQFHQKSKIGGTKNINFKKIYELQPDLIIGNKEENDKSQIEKLAKKFPIWMSDVNNLDEAFVMIKQIGNLTDRNDKATELVQNLQKSFLDLAKSSIDIPVKSVVYLIWRKPYMIAAKNTFINEMLEIAGFENAFKHHKRYPSMTLDEIAKAKPEIILLSSEPYPFKEKHIIELQKSCPKAIIKLADGEMFSWYGNRMMHAARYFETLRKELW